MRTAILAGLLFVSMGLVSCGTMANSDAIADVSISDGSTISLTIDAEEVSKGMTITSNKVVKVTLELKDPSGHTVVTNWYPGQPSSYIFPDRCYGTHRLTVTERDDSGREKTYSGVIVIAKGYNYRVTVTIGGDLIISGIPVSYKKIILLIGDGMGDEHVKAARYYKGSPLSFEAFPWRGFVDTASANNEIPDSAAAGTAFATGVDVNNDVISVAIPGNTNALETILEYVQNKGWRTGVVSTTHFEHATPAVFISHEVSRSSYTAIAADATNLKPNLIMGGTKSSGNYAMVQSAGYQMFNDWTAFKTLNHAGGWFASDHVACFFRSNGDVPYEYDHYTNSGNQQQHVLSIMTKAALSFLDDNQNFFVMIEGGKIDHAGHAANITNDVWETLEFDLAVSNVLAWAQGRNDVLILVTADHETGGLTVLGDNGAGNYPSVMYTSGGGGYYEHTSLNVPIWIYGDAVTGAAVNGIEIENTDVYTLMKNFADR